MNEAHDRPAIAFAMFYSGLVALLTGSPEAACHLFARCGAVAAELGLAPLSARARLMLGFPLLDLGDLSAARAALARGSRCPPMSATAGSFSSGWADSPGSRPRPGVPGWRSGWLEQPTRTGTPTSSPCQDRWRRWSTAGSRRRAPRPVQGGALLAEGRRLGPEEAVALVLANEPDDAPAGPAALTRREVEVAVFAARGLTNRDIAAQLFLSVRTVEVHVDHILTKLGFRTRTQLAAWAYEEGLLSEDT